EAVPGRDETQSVQVGLGSPDADRNVKRVDARILEALEIGLLEAVGVGEPGGRAEFERAEHINHYRASDQFNCPRGVFFVRTGEQTIAPAIDHRRADRYKPRARYGLE